MKKLLGVIALSLLLSTNSFADKISLKCNHSKGSFLRLEFDTNTKKAKFKGTNIDRYFVDKNQFKFLFIIKEYDYRVSIDMYSGVLSVETFFVSKEEKTKMISNVTNKIINEKKDGDLDFLVKAIYNEYDDMDRYILDTAQCEKVKKKL